MSLQEEIKIGDRFNYLTILETFPEYRQAGKYKQKIWKAKCQCDCGSEKILMLSHLKSGSTKSCGCYNTTLIQERSNKFNQQRNKYGTDHPLYSSWKAMKRTCKKDNISYSDEWTIFNNFYEWAIQYWKKNTYLTRITDGDFSPDNCVFKTRKEINQSNPKKYKVTCLDKYGVDHYSKTQEFKDTYHNQIESIKEKIKKTNITKYGTDNTSQLEFVKQKRKETNLKKRGVEYSSQDPSVIAKVKETMQKNGNMYIYQNMNSTELAEKIGICTSAMNARIRKYGYELAVSMEKKESAIEKILSLELDKLNIPYEKQKYIDSKYADFLIKNIIIEVDGLYWHSDKVNKDKNYHQDKRNLYLKNNYFPLFFREDEIHNKLDICISILKNKLNLNSKIPARKCIIIELDQKEKRDFFEQNHLMGSGSGKCIALKFDGELVCAIQYVNKKYIEISRFCTKINTTVIGGYTKLLNQLPEKEIRTFIDLRYGSGEYLSNLGFNKTSEHLSFRWTDFNKTYHRMQFPSNSGYNQGLSKIWDCGQALWVKATTSLLDN